MVDRALGAYAIEDDAPRVTTVCNFVIQQLDEFPAE
jgi:hypothetical protein